MVKSYTGVRKVQEKEIQKMKVQDFMSKKLQTFLPTQSVGEVAQILIDKKLSGGPVVDENGHLIGIISEGDCLKEIVRGKYMNSPIHSGKVEDHMVREVKTTTPEAGILEVAQRFLNEKVRRFPVLKDGSLIGQISQRDILRGVNGLQDSTW
ncbi:MAG: CBS domain-containing protein [Flavobacteriales bacterium]|nr:CBS domain-containing protein [Flavobacteriales bacterium]